jgi:hypothetical protein
LLPPIFIEPPFFIEEGVDGGMFAIFFTGEPAPFVDGGLLPVFFTAVALSRGDCLFVAMIVVLMKQFCKGNVIV